MASRRLSMDMLNDETLMLILMKLPSTQLHRYKCVSKRWFALISDQYFMRRYIESYKNSSQHDNHHFMIHTNPLSQFVLPDHHQLLQHYKSIQNIPDFSLMFLPIARESIHYRKDLKIHGASHGLLLCKGVSRFYVCNPLTRQYLMLPRLLSQIPTNVVGFTCHQLDPTSCEVEFMVIVVGNTTGINSFKTHVFLSKTGKWESFDVACPQGIDRLSFREVPTVFCDGFFHWCPRLPPVSILAYDPINQPSACRLIQIPTTLLPSLYVWQANDIGVIEGRIRIITTRKLSTGKDSKFFNVFEVMDYDKGIFELRYQVHQPRKLAITSKFLSQMNGEIVYFINWSTKKLLMFNMNDGSQQSTLNLSLLSNEMDVYRRALPFGMTPWPTPIPKPPGS